MENTSDVVKKGVYYYNPTCKTCNVKLKNLTGTNMKVCPKCWKQYALEELFEGDEEKIKEHLQSLQSQHEPYFPPSIIGAILSRHLYTRIKPDGIRVGTALCEYCGEKIDVLTYNRKAVNRRVDFVLGKSITGAEVVLCTKCIEPYCQMIKNIRIRHSETDSNNET